jgi:hypothetical protein
MDGLELLYPLNALAGLATIVVAAPLLTRFLPPDLLFDIHPLPMLLTIAAGYATIAGMSRLEYGLARYPVFRIVRHAVRLALFAALTIPLIQLATGLYTPHPVLYILDVIANLQNIALVLRNPENIAIVLVVVVGLHFLLWKAERLRLFWHCRLEAIGLK